MSFLCNISFYIILRRWKALKPFTGALKMIRASTAATAVFDRCNNRIALKKDLDDKCCELRMEQNRIMEINLRILKNWRRIVLQIGCKVWSQYHCMPGRFPTNLWYGGCLCVNMGGRPYTWLATLQLQTVALSLSRFLTC